MTTQRYLKHLAWGAILGVAAMSSVTAEEWTLAVNASPGNVQTF